MKKYPEVFFESSGGEGPLYVYFVDGPYGKAIDDESGNGAGFFSETGQLIGVLVGHVNEAKDEKVLRFLKKKTVSIKVKNGKVIEAKVSPSKKAA